MTILYVDADSCPVKEEVIRVAIRHQIKVYMVSNGGIRPNPDPLIHIVIVPPEPDAADDWIAEHFHQGDIVVTADILLAERCIKAKVVALNPNGKEFNETNIGMAVAMRNLNSELRDTGEHKQYNAGFSKQDRSNFLQGLERVVQQTKKG